MKRKMAKSKELGIYSLIECFFEWLVLRNALSVRRQKHKSTAKGKVVSVRMGLGLSSSRLEL